MLSIFEALGQKVKVLLSIFCGAKITLEWSPPPPPPYLDQPPLPIIPYPPINAKFFQPPYCSLFGGVLTYFDSFHPLVPDVY